MDTALVTGVGAIIITSQQLWIGYRLRQQDNARDEARREARERDHQAAKEREEIHVLVNSNLTAMQNRVADLEQKLGLSSGEAIPGPQTITATTEGEAPQSQARPRRPPG